MVVWGGYYGVLLSIERMFRRDEPAASQRWTLLYPLQAAITFALANISWVFFRAACAILLLAVELLGFTEAAVPFVYFQF